MSSTKVYSVVFLLVASCTLIKADCFVDPKIEYVLAFDRITACSHQLSCIIDLVCTAKIKVLKSDPKSGEEEKKPLRRRKRRAIVDECCLDSCTFYTLLTYCPDKSDYVLQTLSEIESVFKTYDTLRYDTVRDNSTSAESAP